MRISDIKKKKSPYDDHTLRRVYLRTSGSCYICRRKLTLAFYESHGFEGAWKVEHLIPPAEGGTDHPNNLFPVCDLCSLELSAARPPYYGAKTGSAR